MHHHRSGSNGSERSSIHAHSHAHHPHHRHGHARHPHHSGHRQENGSGHHHKAPTVDVLDEEAIEDLETDTRVHVEVHNADQFWAGKSIPSWDPWGMRS